MSAKTVSFKKHKKSGEIYNLENLLVYKSADGKPLKEKIVIGRIFEEEFVPLDDEAVEQCGKLGLKYDETLLKETAEAEEAEETEEQTEETEEAEEAEETQEQAEETEEVPELKKETKKESQKEMKESKKDSPSILTQLEKFISDKEAQSLLDKSSIDELKKQLEKEKKDHEETKRKMKALLATFSSTL